MPKPLSIKPSDLDTSYDHAPCHGGTRVSVHHHHRPLRDLLANVASDTFCLHKHTIQTVDVGTSERVGLALKAIPATLVDIDGAHMLCDRDKSIHDCVPSTEGVDDAVKPLLTNCGWIMDSFTPFCWKKEGQECNTLFDLCENGGAWPFNDPDTTLHCVRDIHWDPDSPAHCRKCTVHPC